MFKNKIPFMILFAVLAAFSIWAVFTQNEACSFSSLMAMILDMNPFWLLAAVVSGSGYIIFEGLAAAVLVKGLLGRWKPGNGIIYGAADVYFSAITPSASGGQPASAFFMIMDGIPAATTTVILLINLIMYTYALLACALFAMIFRWNVVNYFNTICHFLIMIGIIVLFALGFSFRFLLKKPVIIEKFLYFLINLGQKLHIVRNPEVKRAQTYTLIRNYQECARAVSGKAGLLAVCFVLNLFQRLGQSFVTVFCYLGNGGKASNILSVWTVQIFTSLGSNSVPIPGSIGVADYLLINGLSSVEDVTSPANLELVSRGLSFYVCVLISIVIIAAGYLIKKHGHKRTVTRK